jgi:hypothetical protein
MRVRPNGRLFRHISAGPLRANGESADEGDAMATLFSLNAAGDVISRMCPNDRPLHLDADACEAGASWQAAIVPFVVTPRTPRRWAMVVAPGACVSVGATPVHSGITELHDRARILLGEHEMHEMMFSLDALPEPIEAETPRAPCPICLEGAGDGIFACGRCGMRACGRCWSLAPRRECLTAGCHQPAALDRTLWEPAASDFITWEERT